MCVCGMCVCVSVVCVCVCVWCVCVCVCGMCVCVSVVCVCVCVCVVCVCVCVCVYGRTPTPPVASCYIGWQVQPHCRYDNAVRTMAPHIRYLILLAISIYCEKKNAHPVRTQFSIC